MNVRQPKKSQANRKPLHDAVAAAIASAMKKNPTVRSAKLVMDETTGSAHFFSANNSKEVR